MDTSDELLRRKTRLETNTSNAPTSYMCTSKFGDPYRYIETVDLVGYSFSLHYCTMLSHRVLLCTFTVEKVLLWKLLFETSNRSSTKGSSIQPLLWVSMSDLFLSISWTVCLWFILVTTHTHTTHGSVRGKSDSWRKFMKQSPESPSESMIELLIGSNPLRWKPIRTFYMHDWLDFDLLN